MGNLLDRRFFVEDISRDRQFSSTRFFCFEEISAMKQFSSNSRVKLPVMFEDIYHIAEKSSKKSRLD